jgi:hypothetical protein
MAVWFSKVFTFVFKILYNSIELVKSTEVNLCNTRNANNSCLQTCKHFCTHLTDFLFIVEESRFSPNT